jgi:hypothetical protein
MSTPLESIKSTSREVETSSRKNENEQQKNRELKKRDQPFISTLNPH